MRSFEPHLETLASTLLRQLLTPGQMFPDLAQPLAELEQATDWGEAASTGRVVPAKVGSGSGMAGPAGYRGFLVFRCREGHGLPAVAPACCSTSAALRLHPSCVPACKQGLSMVRRNMDWSTLMHLLTEAPRSLMLCKQSVWSVHPQMHMCVAAPNIGTVLGVDSTLLRQRRG